MTDAINPERSIHIGLLIDDLWCVSQGRASAMMPADLAREAVYALIAALPDWLRRQYSEAYLDERRPVDVSYRDSFIEHIKDEP